MTEAAAGAGFSVYFCQGDRAGWAPIAHLARLAAEAFGGAVRGLPETTPALTARLTARLLRRRRVAGAPNALFIARTPLDLPFILNAPAWRRGIDRCALWLIDSYWTNLVPPAPLAHAFDHVFVTFREDVDWYAARFGGPVGWLPWGTDALGLGGADADRPVDALRVGRQPPEWEDDAANEATLAARGLRYRGRPPMLPDPDAQHRALFAEYRRAKFMLAFSNRVSPARFTHPDREYATGRWTDALAAGCVVAGVPPASDETVKRHFWPEAMLAFDTVDRDAGAAMLAEAARAWTPRRAALNRWMALRNLDWRWRLETLARETGFAAPGLAPGLAALRAEIDAAHNTLESC